MDTNSHEHEVARKQKGWATYEIGIEGQIPSYWSEYVDANVVIQAANTSHATMTVLRCEIRDQAQLLGILNLLSSWGSILVWLNRPDAD